VRTRAARRARLVATREPQVISGRYRCRLESGHAAIWWIDEHGLLAHATASNGDLKALFAWWRARSSG
jgi:hypothetical protein